MKDNLSSQFRARKRIPLKQAAPVYPSAELFHGSPHYFQPGDKIDPTPDRIHGGPDKAYASTKVKAAATFGMVTAKEPHKQTRQGELFTPVFSVEPNGEVGTSKYAGHATSETGFTVKGIANWSNTSNADAYDMTTPALLGNHGDPTYVERADAVHAKLAERKQDMNNPQQFGKETP
jgi:hypothetical protein